MPTARYRPSTASPPRRLNTLDRSARRWTPSAANRQGTSVAPIIQIRRRDGEVKIPSAKAVWSRNVRRGRLGVDHGRQVIRAAERQQLARRVREDGGDLRIQRAPGPASHRRGRDIAADGVEHYRRVADGGEP